MKKLFFLSFTLIFSVILFSDVKDVENSLQPKVSGQELKLENSFALNEDLDSIQNFIMTNERIYFVNSQAKSVTILDLEGKIIKVLDQTGRGPGEFSLPFSIFNDEKKSCVGVVDQMNQRTSYFDYDGNYLEDVLFEQMQIPMDIKYIDDKKIYFYMGIEFDQKKGSVLSKPTIELIAGDSIKFLYSESFNPLKMNIGESKIPIYAKTEKNIYITNMSYDEYRIQVLDADGEHIMNITKKIKKIKKSAEDIKEIENTLEEVKKQVKASGADLDMNFSGYEFENTITSMLIGPEGNLWVQTVDKNGNLFDIIGKDGKIIGQCRKVNDKFENCKFYKNKLYEITGNEDDGFVLNIYTLKN
ncbi:MAG: 6-bladed beta-propeller [Candidatus Cloacimonetes bacterium]|nr:6-bladed beta-propeller [Candidatus Cloacimonadota bacterium]